MEFKRGADVHMADGKKVGDVERVVMDPVTKEVTHIVIDKGIMFSEDKVVPLTWIEEAEENRVTLRAGIDQQEFDELPSFETFDLVPFTPADEDYPDTAPTPLYWYPTAGVAWWDYPGLRGFYSRPAYIVEEEENIPEGAVALRAGAKVIAADGEQVGTVERVITAEGGNRATHLVVSEGVLFPEKKLIPTNWINSVQEDRVLLAVGETLLEQLQDYEE